MVILDSFAVLALLTGEPAAPEVRELLGDAQLTSTGVAEVLDRLVRVHGQAEEEVALDLAELGLLDGLPVDAADGLGAGLLRAHHYHRTTCAVSLADCLVAQAARRAEGAVATADPHLLDLCDAEAIATIVLPDSAGNRARR
ncbi:MAG TPA: PIN domain-containing protein [Acidimicrobiales bacterium]